MPTPGITFNIGTALPASGLPSDTGSGFMATAAAAGPTTRPQLVSSLDDFVAKYGPRVSYSLGYDAADAFFNEGGSALWVVRFAGPGATLDALFLKDAGAANSVQVQSIGPGASGLSVAVVAGVGTGSYQVVITVTATGVVLEQSYDLLTATDAAAWGQSSKYVTMTAVGTNPPAIAAAAPLTGGADDLAHLGDTQRTASLALFSSNLGPGQVFVPGATTDAVRTAIVAHALANNRFGLLDFADTATATTLAASGAVIRGGNSDPSFAAGLAPWLQIPGLMRGTLRLIPPSAAIAGLMARQDHLTGDPNNPAAGGNGRLRYATAVTQEYVDADRGTLNSAGIDVIRMVRSGSNITGLRLYGYRTLADPVNAPSWSTVGSARLRMAIEADARIIGQDFMFAELDGQGNTVSHFHGRLVDMLTGYWSKGALYGATPQDAFLVDTGPAVNTPLTLSNNQLNATIAIRLSPMAERIVFNITPIPVTQALTAA